MGSLSRLAWSLCGLSPGPAMTAGRSGPTLPLGGADASPALRAAVFDLAAALALVAFLIVCWSSINFRPSRAAPDPERPARGGAWSWAVVPVLVLGIVVALNAVIPWPSRVLWNAGREAPVEVRVTGSQWGWDYEYLGRNVRLPGAGLALQTLVLPVGRPVRLLLTSTDVPHDFWVPALGLRQEAIPGYVTEARITLVGEGSFRGQCAPPCGEGQSVQVTVVGPERFDDWLARQRGDGGAAAGPAPDANQSEGEQDP